eukprot:5868476-Amphidinium_carterae.1
MVEQTVTAAFPLYKLAAAWRSSKAKLPNQAQAFTRDLVMWLEQTVLDSHEDKVTRLLCGRFRLLVGASLRGDDLRRTSPSFAGMDSTGLSEGRRDRFSPPVQDWSPPL